MTRALDHGPGPLDFPDSPLSRAARQPLMLGLFLPLQTGAFSQSTLPPRDTRWDFEYNRHLTQLAERSGFEFVFGLQQWVGKGGFGGEMNYRENFLDPFISTIALSTVTTSILSISTVHVLYGNWHPMHLARFAATADHIAGGRYGSTSSPATPPASRRCSAWTASTTTAATTWPTSSPRSSPTCGTAARTSPTTASSTS